MTPVVTGVLLCAKKCKKCSRSDNFLDGKNGLVCQLNFAETIVKMTCIS